MITEKSVKQKHFKLRPRRGVFYQAKREKIADLAFFENLDLVYRTLCAALYNFVPTSGHPGGSISSGRIVASLFYETMDYDFSDPDAGHADWLCYCAGHKALGLYSASALRNELISIARPDLLAPEKRQLRLEDLLGFRRNPTTKTPLFQKFNAKALDGHPTCAVPFVPVATGASGVGVGAALGFALGARDFYGQNSPRINLLEGEGGMTPGRVHEAIAAAATMGLDNVVMHVDWNQASIDSNHLCAEDGLPGDYVQWDPAELLYLHDWNVVFVKDGLDFNWVIGAQKLAQAIDNGQPTAVVYRTQKGWKYGIEGRASHGAGHPFCSPGYYQAIEPFEKRFRVKFPRFEGDKIPERVEEAFFKTLSVVRDVLKNNPEITQKAAEKILASKERLSAKARRPRANAPRLEAFYASPLSPEQAPQELAIAPGKSVTLRAALGNALGYLNNMTQGAFFGCAADLYDSTSLSALGGAFPKGFYHTKNNAGSRLAAVGGICEDAMGAFMAGLSSFGRHVGATSSYAGFIAALEHIAARLHGISQQTRRHATGEPFRTWVMINAHVGPMTGEDGPTHADPQALQLLEENFPKGVLITLTPWDPQEVWPLLIAGLKARPAVLCPFVSRPAEIVPDRQALSIAPAHAAAKGVYALRRAFNTKKTVVFQGSASTTIFVKEVLPKLDQDGIRLNIFYVAGPELFDLLPEHEQEAIFPTDLTFNSIGITDFTLPTLYRWVRSKEGLSRSLYPFKAGAFLGSGQWEKVLIEAGLDGPSQLKAIVDWYRCP
ncbi:MAG: hypothetical protein HY747_09615 [Elusimicrobia bacterium]|nr:hypothetical protein [Elusimicrobiota bacterium]